MSHEKKMAEDAEGFLVLTRYKGHPDSRVVQDEAKIQKIKAVEDVYPPGTWHYDPETGVPVPGSD